MVRVRGLLGLGVRVRVLCHVWRYDVWGYDAMSGGMMSGVRVRLGLGLGG